MIVAAALGLSCSKSPPEGGRAPLFAGPMIQMVTPESFIIAWVAAENEPIELEASAPDGTGLKSAEFVENMADRRAVRFTGLMPQMAYRYKLVLATGAAAGKGEPVSGEPAGGTTGRNDGTLAGTILAEGTARTAPRPGQAFRILAFGDRGTSDRTPWQLAEKMEAYHPDRVIHLGDIVYEDGERE